jgi:hypothetical protein
VPRSPSQHPHGGYLATQTPIPTEAIECPLCLGEGKLKRTQVLDRLGVKDFARVAQLSAEEAFRLLQSKHKQDELGMWARFEGELVKRTADMDQRHQAEVHSLVARTKELEGAARVTEQQKAHEVEHANRRVEDSLREVATLKDRNHELQSQVSKVARVGRREELSFEDEARTWAGMCISEKLPKNGDFILAYRDPSGMALEPQILVDCKDKLTISEVDISKLVRDAKERLIPVAILVTREEQQLRQVDKDTRWDRKDGVWILRTTRQWLPRDLEVLKPLFERMRIQGLDFLDKNVSLADEVRRSFSDLDRVEGELKKATKAITSASGLVSKYKGRLVSLCATTSQKLAHIPQPDYSELAQAGD